MPEKAPESQNESFSELVVAQRGTDAIQYHTAARLNVGGGGCPGSEIVPHEGCHSELGVGHRGPLIARQPEWPARQPTVPMERIAEHKSRRLSRLEKRALLPCPRGRRESSLALGILTARQPNKTHGPRCPLPKAC